MEIKVLLFGQLADLAQTNELLIDNVDNSEALSGILYTKFPALREINFRMAVNKKIIQQNTPLSEGDEVALLPPFSGG